MRAKTAAAIFALLLFPFLRIQARALDAQELVPGGGTVGIELETGGVIVVGLTDVETEQGPASPAEAAGIRSGDVIKSIDGQSTANAAEFLTVMRGIGAGAHSVTVARGGEELELRIVPACNREGAYQFGLWLRDSVAGIGTVTYYDPETGTFGALGHGISDSDSGELLPFETGNITRAEVIDVIRGNPGSPGELCGEFDHDAVLGSLSKNTENGIFGFAPLEGGTAPIPVAAEDEVVLGPAVIRSDVGDGGVREYGVEISRIYRGTDDGRFLLLTVTDPALLNRTGGIVQGMSGSPILQNGKLVGAVTHVLISDPTRGYGISIERMLEAA